MALLVHANSKALFAAIRFRLGGLGCDAETGNRRKAQREFGTEAFEVELQPFACFLADNVADELAYRRTEDGGNAG